MADDKDKNKNPAEDYLHFAIIIAIFATLWSEIEKLWRLGTSVLKSGVEMAQLFYRYNLVVILRRELKRMMAFSLLMSIATQYIAWKVWSVWSTRAIAGGTLTLAQRNEGFEMFSYTFYWGTSAVAFAIGGWILFQTVAVRSVPILNPAQLPTGNVKYSPATVLFGILACLVGPGFSGIFLAISMKDGHLPIMPALLVMIPAFFQFVVAWAYIKVAQVAQEKVFQTADGAYALGRDAVQVGYAAAALGKNLKDVQQNNTPLGLADLGIFLKNWSTDAMASIITTWVIACAIPTVDHLWAGVYPTYVYYFFVGLGLLATGVAFWMEKKGKFELGGLKRLVSLVGGVACMVVFIIMSVWPNLILGPARVLGGEGLSNWFAFLVTFLLMGVLVALTSVFLRGEAHKDIRTNVQRGVFVIAALLLLVIGVRLISASPAESLQQMRAGYNTVRSAYNRDAGSGANQSPASRPLVVAPVQSVVSQPVNSQPQTMQPATPARRSPTRRSRVASNSPPAASGNCYFSDAMVAAHPGSRRCDR